jgi:hypothetical protein
LSDDQSDSVVLGLNLSLDFLLMACGPLCQNARNRAAEFRWQLGLLAEASVVGSRKFLKVFSAYKNDALAEGEGPGERLSLNVFRFQMPTVCSFAKKSNGRTNLKAKMQQGVQECTYK